MPFDRFCLHVWLRNKETVLSARYPEHRARYRTVARFLSQVVDEGWLPEGSDARERAGAGTGADAGFTHEPRLAFLVSLLAV